MSRDAFRDSCSARRILTIVLHTESRLPAVDNRSTASHTIPLSFSVGTVQIEGWYVKGSKTRLTIS